MGPLETPRLWLEEITLPLVEAIFANDREKAETIGRCKIPEAWPGRALVERAFCASLEAIRTDPDKRLWGDRLMITKGEERILVGSVIFHGLPANGVAEVGYGVEHSWQNKGLATEATRACVDWALAQEGIVRCRATTPPWHTASVRVLEKSGLARAGSEDHDSLGEVLVFQRER